MFIPNKSLNGIAKYRKWISGEFGFKLIALSFAEIEFTNYYCYIQTIINIILKIVLTRSFK